MVVVEMKKEKQVVCLELAREMKELGATQDSLWHWTWAEWNGETEMVLITQDEAGRTSKEIWSAYTVAELGEILPYYVHSYKEDARSGRWCCDEGDKQCFSNTEANARAKMLIYLVECNKIQRAKM